VARFLRYQPYDTTNGFKVHLKDAITYRPEKGYARLQAVLAAIMLRRTKDTQLHGRPIIELPKREQSLVQVGDTRRPPCMRRTVMGGAVHTMGNLVWGLVWPRASSREQLLSIRLATRLVYCRELDS
jgi:hypothetical protein